jgi:hypothetical protein
VQLAGPGLELRGQRRGAGPDGLDRLLGPGELVTPAAARLRVARDQLDRPAVLALEAVEQPKALLDLVEPPGAPSMPSP